MATFAAIPDFIESQMEGETDLRIATNIKMALSNTAPGSESSPTTTSGNGVLANVTEISYTNYTDDMATDRVLENTTSDESGGTYKYDADNIVITASGGTLATFRYIYLFDDNGTTPTDPLIGSWDHGSAISLATGESATITWNASGIFTIA